MEITNLTPDIGELQGTTYNLKNIDYNKVVSFKLLIKSKAHIRTKFGCGSCTKGESVQKGKDIELTVNYTPSKGGAKGNFSKSITVYYIGGETKIIFNGTAL